MEWILLILILLLHRKCYRIEKVVKDNNRVLYRINKALWTDGKTLGQIKLKLNKLNKTNKKEVK